MRYGVEIEFVSRVNAYAVVDALRAAGVEMKDYTGYSDAHVTCNKWKVVHDGSVVGTTTSGAIYGMEVVSPPMEDDANAQHQIETVCRVLQEMPVGGRINQSCGLHIHVNAEGMSLNTIKRICYMYSKNERFIDMVQPRSRRGSSNTYCRSVSNASELSIKNAKSVRDLYSTVSMSSRFYKVNLDAFRRHKTIEFRQHSGTIEAQKIINWKNFIMKMVEVGQKDATGPAATFENAVGDPRSLAARLPWRKRTLRILVQMAGRPEGVTPLEARNRLGTENNVDIAWYFRDSRIPFHKTGSRGNWTFFLGEARDTATQAMSEVNLQDLEATCFQDLMAKLNLSADQRAFWNGRYNTLNPGAAR